VNDGSLFGRAERHAALGDPTRLRIVDELARSDRSPGELGRIVGIESNLLAHHLDVLESVGLVERTRSHADGRRRYVHLVAGALPTPAARPIPRARAALFVCTRNSARSQLAAALWREHVGAARSAGTDPATNVHPGAVAAARRAGLDLDDATTTAVSAVTDLPAVVVTVCDEAHEALAPPPDWWHWSIADPVPDGSPAAFDAAVDELRRRITAVATVVPG
jgi:protein-tyrosine-phosphatase